MCQCFFTQYGIVCKHKVWLSPCQPHGAVGRMERHSSMQAPCRLWASCPLTSNRYYYFTFHAYVAFLLTSVRGLALVLSRQHLPICSVEGPAEFPQPGHCRVPGEHTAPDIPGPPIDDANQCPKQAAATGREIPLSLSWIRVQFLLRAFTGKSEDGCPVHSQHESLPSPAELSWHWPWIWLWGHFCSLEKSLAAPSSIKTCGGNNGEIALPCLCQYATISLVWSCSVSLNVIKKLQWIETCQGPHFLWPKQRCLLVRSASQSVGCHQPICPSSRTRMVSFINSENCFSFQIGVHSSPAFANSFQMFASSSFSLLLLAFKCASFFGRGVEESFLLFTLYILKYLYFLKFSTVTQIIARLPSIPSLWCYPVHLTLPKLEMLPNPYFNGRCRSAHFAQAWLCGWAST